MAAQPPSAIDERGGGTRTPGLIRANAPGSGEALRTPPRSSQASRDISPHRTPGLSALWSLSVCSSIATGVISAQRGAPIGAQPPDSGASVQPPNKSSSERSGTSPTSLLRFDLRTSWNRDGHSARRHRACPSPRPVLGRWPLGSGVTCRPKRIQDPSRVSRVYPANPGPYSLVGAGDAGGLPCYTSLSTQGGSLTLSCLLCGTTTWAIDVAAIAPGSEDRAAKFPGVEARG
ncbi:hypothetical protein BDV95DRAFT_635738 [Massariosphaeria phaeospora]|uniref:Uncharacterized protein n=1 Tax=Massariosphaeria phaeospora TaxID=100035 RepID=A0A7C8MAV5_9PLEO|nr:hypothetical protein BDV95DRAFT_635738 [Massariosphaeria phaeospora]